MTRRSLRRPSPGTGPQEALRRRHLGAVLDLVHVTGPMSRAELTASLGLNRSTVAGLVGELTRLGAVAEEAPEPGRSAAAGRPSPIVTPRSERVQVVAAEVAVDRLLVARVGVGGRVLERRRVPLDGPDVVTAARLLGELVTGLTAGIPAGRVVGVGVSVPGAVRHEDGFVRFAPNLGWTDVPFGDLLRGAIGGLPLRVGNDAELGALAEHRRGAARGVDDLAYVTIDVGVGGGLFADGRPLRGAGGYAGELGHLTVRPGGSRCRCGSRGCWETEVGAGAIARALGLPEDSHPEELGREVQGLAKGDPRLDEVAGWLGTGLADLVNLLNPRMVVLGGLLRDVLTVAGQRVRAELDAGALAASAEQVGLAAAQLGDDATLFGAAELGLQDVLADPAGVLDPDHGEAAGWAAARPTGTVAALIVGGPGQDEEVDERRRRPAGPPGWPAEVVPPDAPGWQRSAVAWLLDQCPAEYRGYDVLTRHPAALARVAMHHVTGARQANGKALAGARSDLAATLPPEALNGVLEALDTESARLMSAERGVQLLLEALDGRRHVPRL